MGTVTLKGNKTAVEGTFLVSSNLAPDFVLVNKALENVTLNQFKGKKKVIATLPSVDTSVCSMESMELQRIASSYPEIAFIVVSKDLPFGQERFCLQTKISNITFLSDLRPRSQFGKDYGVLVTEGPLAGVLARSIIVLSENDQVIYAELVPEISHPPDFAKLEEHLR